MPLLSSGWNRPSLLEPLLTRLGLLLIGPHSRLGDKLLGIIVKHKFLYSAALKGLS